LIGATGAGKSSIVNALFGDLRAPVSDGKPCTEKFNYYPAINGRTVHLYDSKGLEPMKEKTFLSNLEEFIAQRNTEMKNDITKGIHCVWYSSHLSCICLALTSNRYVLNAATARWSEGDTQIVRDILHHIPTIIVLNKCDLATELQIDEVIDNVKRSKIPVVKGITPLN
jgi:predicted GTPase